MYADAFLEIGRGHTVHFNPTQSSIRIKVTVYFQSILYVKKNFLGS